ncbi:hypothetical protein [Halovenus halobia]|uniref:hypothetical protein n=1 Tax=Halovenus halobia TaxID=3396622 RepID=UPI003F55BDA1
MSGTALSDLLSERRRNATIAWLLLGIAALAGIGGVIVTGPLWSVFAVVIVLLGLVPPVSFRSRYVMLPWEVLAVALLPLIGIALGAGRLSSPLVSYLAIAAVGLVIVVELDSFTSIQMSPGFAIVLVVASTMAASALWAMLEWYVAIALDRSFELTNDELMIEFIYAVFAGFVGGIIFRTYFRRYVTQGRRVPEEFEDTVEGGHHVDN